MIQARKVDAGSDQLAQRYNKVRSGAGASGRSFVRERILSSMGSSSVNMPKPAPSVMSPRAPPPAPAAAASTAGIAAAAAAGEHC